MTQRHPPLPSRRHVLAGLGATLVVPALARRAQATPSVAPQRVADDFDEPWAFGFLPDGVLVTERGGRLTFLGPDGRGRRRVAGVPQVQTGGQGGLLDVMIPRDFARTRHVFLSFSRAVAGGVGTALGYGTLSADHASLADFRVIFSGTPGRGGVHFGSRIVELPDGTLALTIGDRGNGDTAQDLMHHAGSVIRVNRDGSVPRDNPFVGRSDARPEIWSTGHRNPQVAALDAQGRLWVSEHGARGGDEVNLVKRGRNYGWPVIAYGRNYSGTAIGIGTAAPGMEQPRHYWDPSIAPSGHLIHSGRMFAEWKGRHLVGSLRFDMIAVLDPTTRAPGGWAETRIATAETARVRDVREAPDGAVWFASVGNGALYRIARGAA